MLVSVAAMLPLLPALLGAALAPAGAPSAAPPVHRMVVQISGPFALVEVERSISLEGSASSEERVLDVALPAGAALVGWHVQGTRLAPVTEDRARDEHARALAGRGAVATRLPLEQGTDYRLHVAGRAGQPTLVRYRYTAPLACRRGRFVLAVPGSLEAEPVPAQVTVEAPGLALSEVQLAGASVHLGSAARSALKAPARAAWELSFALAAPRSRPALLAARSSDPGLLAVGICATDQDRELPAPERVVLLMDRSRSVGPAGIVLERDLARALVDSLPPSVRFNAVFFDRAVDPLFSLARVATTEALSALTGAAGPGQLANGTDLPRALHLAAQMARAEGKARTWLVVISDGALPEEQTAPVLLAATAGLPLADTRVVVLLVRPGGDEAPGPAARVALRALPARFGGILRTADPADLRAAAVEAVAATRRGGDRFALALGTPGESSVEVIGMLARTGGETRVVRWPGTRPPPTVASMRYDGRSLTMPVHAASVAMRWMAPLAASRRTAWRAGGVMAWVEPAPVAAPAEPEEVTRGQMDRGVVHNALSLAYLPRARACYLNRSARTAADQELRGRLRLELTLERGEMLAATVRGSTLGRADIEACLREAAFGLDVPRPLHSDAPVVAALNLQFQPRSAPSATPDASPMGREIDLIIGPISPTDPLDLLASPTDGGKPPAPPTPGSP
jgi:hypothetical protein